MGLDVEPGEAAVGESTILTASDGHELGAYLARPDGNRRNEGKETERGALSI